MAKKNILDLAIASTKTGGTTYIVIGGADYQIPMTTLFADETTAIANNTLNIATNSADILALQGLINKQIYNPLVVPQTFSLALGAAITGVALFYLTLSPKIKIGTTLGGDEIMSEKTLTSASDSRFITLTHINTSGAIDETIYVTISGGTMKLGILINQIF